MLPLTSALCSTEGIERRTVPRPPPPYLSITCVASLLLTLDCTPECVLDIHDEHPQRCAKKRRLKSTGSAGKADHSTELRGIASRPPSPLSVRFCPRDG